MDQKGQCRFLCSIRKWGLFVKSALMLIAPSLYALPEGQEVVQGTADCTHPDPQSMCIQASDQAIINYQKFSIGSGERVQFIQPSSHSSVLNRVTGTDPSAILGSLQSNGRVFLVNPQGIYFGKDAVVNVGGLVASTLNIRDEDFAQGNYRFYLEDGSLGSQIVNEGRISAETSVALFAPYIDNLGSIIAQTGTIAMGSAQRITLDFSGDGLISFCVDETLSDALIRQGVGGSSPVRMDFAAAERTIKMVVNTDGLTAANTIEESEGVFRLVNTGSMNAAAVSMDGPRVALTGLIDVSNLQPEMTGGRVEVFGDRIDLRGARIDASGDAGGGTVLIGGEYQGKGSRHNARTSVMDENSWIHADAITSGDGGKVVVWADDAALFYGTISARGNEGGQGGLVETSGKQNLGVGTLAHVDTWAPNDRYGNWLLDPASITIATGGGATIAQCSSPNCADANVYTLAPNTIAASATNVSLCAMNAAASFITVSNNISMTNSGVGLTLTAGSGSVGPINLNANITTRGGAIVLNGVMTVGANVALSTINATPAGSSITLNGTVNASGTRTLTLGGGTSGTVTLAGAVGATTSLNTLTATGATVAQNSSVRTIGNVAYTGTSAINIGGSITTTASGSITLTGPVNLTNTPTLDTTFAGATTGATISFTSTLNGAVPLVLRAGTVGNVIFGGIVGGSSPLTNLSFTSANQIRVGNNITVTGANPLIFPSAVLLNGTSTIQSNLNNNISFNSTINAASLGVQGLTVTTGSGLITLSGAVGATTALNSLSTTAATVTQSSSVRTTGSVSHTGTSAINIGGSITTTASGSITLTGPVIITNTPTLDTTNAGGTTGANIRFTSTLDGAVPLVLRSGTVGNVIFSGIVGGTNPLANLSFTSANQIQIGNDIRVTGTNVLTFPGASAVIVNGSGLCTVTSNSNNTITFGGTVNGPQALAVVTGAGAITFSGAIGGSTLPASLAATATGGTVTQSSTAIVTGAVNYTASTINVNGSITTSGGAITCTGNTVMANAPTFSTTSADITFSANLNGATAPTFLAGTGVVTFGGAVGNAVVPTNLTFTSASLIRVGGNVTVTGANPLNFSQPTAITGISTFLTNNAAITFGNTLIGPQALTITAGSGAINFNSTVGGTPLSSLTITSASTVTASGSISAGTITESGVSNLSTFHALTTSAIGGISLTGNQFSIDGNIITTGSGPCSITNAGLLTLIGGSSTSISGAFNQNGAGAVSLSGKILTTGTNLSFLRAITLAGATQLASGGGTIALSSTVDGAGDLTLTAGSGAINLSGAIGATRIGAFLIQSAGPVTTSSIRAASITQASGSTTTFGGALNTNGNSGISLTGTDFNLNGTITTTTSGGATTGSCTINNSGALTLPLAATANIAGSFQQTNITGTVSLANAITAGESISFRGPVTVAGSAAELNISAASQSITLYNTVNGTTASANPLTLAAGSGDIDLQQTVGGTTRLGALTVSSGATVSMNAVNAASLTQSHGSVLTQFNGAVSSSGAISLTGKSFTVNQAMATSSGSISVAFESAGTFTTGSSGAITVGGAATSFQQTGTGANDLAANVTTGGGGISWVSPITLSGDVTLSNGGGANTGAIQLQNTVDGAHVLTLIAGAGSLSITGPVGATPLTGLTINSAASVTATNGISAGTITAGAVSRIGGVVSFTSLTAGGGGISLTGSAITINGDLITTGGGLCTIDNAGVLTLNGGASTSMSGAFSQSGAGSVSLSGKVATTAANLSFLRAITLTGAADLNSGGGTLHLYNTVGGDGINLTLASGVGDILLDAAIGSLGHDIGALSITNAATVTVSSSIWASTITQSDGSVETTFSGAVLSAGDISLTGKRFSIQNTMATTNGSIDAALTNEGSFVTNSAGHITVGGASNHFAQTQTGSATNQLSGNVTTQGGSITWNSPVTLARSLTFSNGGGAATGTIECVSTVVGPFNLNVIAGSGAVNFDNSVGLGNALTALSIQSAGTITASSSIQADTISVGATTRIGGLAAFGAMTSSSGGITLVGSAITISGNIITTGGGVCSIDNGGVCTLTGGSSTSISGVFNQNGAGSVSLSGKILTTGTDLSFLRAVELAGNTQLLSEGGTITLSSTVDNAYDLALTAGSGTINLNGAIGTTRLGAFSIESAGTVNTASIRAASITQAAGATTIFGGALNTDGSAGINLTGGVFTMNGSLTATGTGPCLINNTGLLTLPGDPLTVSVAGAFQQTGAGSVSLECAVTAGGTSSFSGLVLLNGTHASFTTAASSITFVNEIRGTAANTDTLVLNSGTNDIVFQKTVGSVGTPLGALTIQNAQNVTATSSIAPIYVDSLTQSNGTGTTTFNGVVSSAGVISLTTLNCTLNAVMSTVDGSIGVALNDTGTFTTVSGAAITVGGASNHFAQTQTGSTGFNVLAANVTTAGGAITWNSPINLNDAVQLSNGGGAATGAITLKKVDEDHNLTLIPGAGAINFDDTIGGTTPIHALAITDASGTVTSALGKTISSYSITQTGTGTAIFNGALNAHSTDGVKLTGTNITLNGPVTTTLNGPFEIHSTGGAVAINAAVNLSGPFSQDGTSPVALSANISTDNDAISFTDAPITLGGDATLYAGTGLGDTSFGTGSTVDGGYALIIDGQNGNVVFDSDIGVATALASFTISSANNVTLQNIGGVNPGVSGATSIETLPTGTIFLEGTVYHANEQTYTSLAIECKAGALTTFTTSGDAVSFNATSMILAAATDVTIQTFGGDIHLSPTYAGSSSGRTMTLEAGAGDVYTNTIGLSGDSEFAAVNLSGADIYLRGSLFADAAAVPSVTGNIYLGGDVTTTTAVTFTRPVIRDTVLNATVTSNGTDITFDDTISDSTAGYTRDLTLIAGAAGSVTLTGAVGVTPSLPLRRLYISSVKDVHVHAISAGSIAQAAGVGITTLDGNLKTNGILGINLAGKSFVFTGAGTIDTTIDASVGSLAIDCTDSLEMAALANCTIGGFFAQTGAGTVSLANNIWASDNITFASQVQLSGDVIWDSSDNNNFITCPYGIIGAHGVTVRGGNGTFSSGAAIGEVGTPLTLLSVESAGTVTLQAVYANQLSMGSTSEISGMTTFNGALNVGAGGIRLIGHDYTRNSTITTTGGGNLWITNSGSVTGTPGPVIADGYFKQDGVGSMPARFSITTHGGSITISGPVNLLMGASTLISGNAIGGSDITFSNTIDGTQNLTLDAGGNGIISFDNALGSNTPLGILTVTNAQNVNVNSISAASIVQTAGTGTTDLQGAVTTSTSDGVVLNTKSVTIEHSITTASEGPLTITIANDGVLDVQLGAVLTIDGDFTQNGTGTVLLADQLITTGDKIEFYGPVILENDVTLNAGTSLGSIITHSTVDSDALISPRNWTLSARLGTIHLYDAVGGTYPIGDFSINQVGTATLGAITAAKITQVDGTVSTTVEGALSASGILGIVLTGAVFDFQSTIDAAAGPFTLNNSGTATFENTSGVQTAGAFTQSGSGETSLACTIQSDSTIQFQGPLTVPATGALNTSDQSITLLNTLGGTGDITFTLGSGDLITQTVGTVGIPFGHLMIASAHNVEMSAIYAATVTQTDSFGTTPLTHFHGIVSGSGGIDLTGDAFTFNDNVQAAAGLITIANRGTLTTASNFTISSLSGFSQTGVGAVSLAGTINVNKPSLIGDPHTYISFAGPITLTSPVVLDTTIGGGNGRGDITFGPSSTIIGSGQNLTLAAGVDVGIVTGGGTITLGASLGAGVGNRLGQCQVTSAHNITMNQITASSIIMLASSGTATISGTLDTDGPGGIQVTGTNFTRNGSIYIANSSLIVTNSGTITGTVPSTTDIDGSYTQISGGGGSAADLAGTITARGGISYESPITLIGPATLDSGNGDITLSNTVQSLTAQNLTLSSGIGDITFVEVVGGGGNSLGKIQINTADDVTAEKAITAASILVPSLPVFDGNLAGVATFKGLVTTTGAAGIVLKGTQFTWNDDITTTGNGPLSITNSGTLAFTHSPTAVGLDGAFTQSGAGSVSIQGSITTTADPIEFAGTITLTGDTTLASHGGVITLQGAVDGAYTLELAGGAGAIALQSGIGSGTPPTALTITGGTIDMQANIVTNGSITTTATGLASPGTTIEGSVTANLGDISLTGVDITINDPIETKAGQITITNSGLLQINQGDPITAYTKFEQIHDTGGTVELGADISSTTGKVIFNSPISLIGPVSLNANGNGIEINGAVDDSIALNQYNLTLQGGAGNITFGAGAAIGATRRIGDLIIPSVAVASLQDITAKAIIQSGGSSTFNGPIDINAATGIQLTGSAFTFEDAATVTTTAGAIAITHSGALNIGTGAWDLSGSFTESGGGVVTTQASMNTYNQTVQFGSPVEVAGTVSIDVTHGTNTGAGNIVFLNTLDDSVSNTNDLTLIVGSGLVRTTQIVGGVHPLKSMSITIGTGGASVHSKAITVDTAFSETGEAMHFGGDVTATNGDITLTGDVVLVNSVIMSSAAGNGDIHITGTGSLDAAVAGYNVELLAGAGNVAIDGALGSSVPFFDVTIEGANITVHNMGSSTPAATGTTILNAGTQINFEGSVYVDGTQTYTAISNFYVNVADTTFTSSGNPITFSTGTINLTAGALTINSNGGDITISNLVGEGYNLTLNAGSGDIVTGSLGTLGHNVHNVDLTAASFSPVESHPYPANYYADSVIWHGVGISYIYGDTTFPGDQTYSNPVRIQVTGPVTLGFTCPPGGYNLIFNYSLDADSGFSPEVTINACGGSVTFNGPVGASFPLTSLAIDGAVDVNVNNVMNTGFFAQTAGTGITTFASGLTTTAKDGSDYGIKIATDSVDFTGSFKTSHDAICSITTAAGGTFAGRNGVDFDVGSFVQAGSGSGGASFGGQVKTYSSGAISFEAPLTLTSGTNLLTSGGNISLGTVDGGSNLVLSSGAGAITCGNLGSTTRIGSLDIQSAANVTTGGVKAASINQSAGTGLTDFQGNLDVNTINGIQIVGTDCRMRGNVTVTGGGSLIMTQTGTWTTDPGVGSQNQMTVAGAVTQNGTGAGSANVIGCNITAGNGITFNKPVALSPSTFNTVTMDTSATVRDIVFGSTLQGPGGLTATLGSIGLVPGGDLTIVGAAGLGTPLGAITINYPTIVSTLGITAGSIHEVGGTGLTTIAGDLTTTAVGGISLEASSLNINGSLITGALGPVELIASGGLTFAAGGSTSIAGSFTQLGDLEVTLSGTVATVNQSLSFAGALNLVGATVLSTGAGAGDISCTGSITGSQNLELTAGSGTILMSSAIGTPTPLGALTVHSVAGMTYPQLSASSVLQVGSTGETIINHTMTTSGIGGISLTGTAITQSAIITAGGTGSVSITNSGALTITANTVANGGYSQNGSAGSVSIQGAIATNGGAIAFEAPITLTGTTNLSTGATGADITFGPSSTIHGANNLVLNANDHTLWFKAAVGEVATSLGDLQVTAAQTVTADEPLYVGALQVTSSSTVSFDKLVHASSASITSADVTLHDVTTTSGALAVANTGQLTLDSAPTLSVATDFTQSTNGLSQISGWITTTNGTILFNGPVKVSGSADLNSSAGSKPIIFGSIVQGISDGSGTLTLNASSANDITFNQDVGGGSLSLSGIVIENARNVTAQGITVGTLTQQAGHGLSEFRGDVVAASGAISLTAAGVSFLGNVTGGSTITIANTGTLTTTRDKTIASTGSFTQSGAGGVSLAGTITVEKALLPESTPTHISFAGPINLAGPVVLNTTLGSGAGVGNISFGASAAIVGDHDLTLIAGGGNITVFSSIGAGNRIGQFAITSAYDVHLHDVAAASILQTAGSGTTTYNGALNTNGSAGFVVTGTNFSRIDTSITITNGSLTVTNSGLITGTGGNTTNIDGSYTQLSGGGSSAINLAGTISAQGGISYESPITLVGNTILNSGAGGASVMLHNSVDGTALQTYGLTITAGLGSVTFDVPIGFTNPLGYLTVSGDTFSLNDIGTAGRAGVSGDLSISGSEFLFLGSTYNAHKQTYTTMTDFDIEAIGVTTLFQSNGSDIEFKVDPSAPATEGFIGMFDNTALEMQSDGGAISVVSIKAEDTGITGRSVILDATGSTNGNITIGAVGEAGYAEIGTLDLKGNDIYLNGNIIADVVHLNEAVASPGTVYASANITCLGVDGLHFHSDCILKGSNLFSVASTAPLMFHQTLDGDGVVLRRLTLTAPSGNISLMGVVGGGSLSDY